MENKGIFKYEALTMTTKTFKQIREVDKFELPHIAPAIVWEGYVIEHFSGSHGDLQIFWFITKKNDTLVRIRETDLFWLLRTPENKEPTRALIDSLPQIFTT